MAAALPGCGASASLSRMTNSAEELAARATQAGRAGRAEEAAALWRAALAADPTNPKALFAEGRRRVEQGDVSGGMALLSQAEARDKSNPEIPLYVALAQRMQGDYGHALQAIDRALAIDPYFFMALLSKGALFEGMAQPRQAARIYRDAIKIAPPPERLAPAQRAAFDHAKDVVAENAQAMQAHLRTRTAAARARFAGERLERFDECLDILAGVKPRHQHDPTLLYFPRLPPIPFYDRDHFPWLEKLEAATDMIREELAAAVREDHAKFKPYIQYPAHAPVNQWVELNHSPSWSTYFLWQDGERQADNCARCPQTAALLDELPMAHQAGYGPTAMFSTLAPRTHIPPHTGSANVRLIVHLPLVLPPDCRFRVGNETRDWRMNEAWVFDDTIEHEAWNNSDQVRHILIFDVWNPLLSAAERELVCEMMAALNSFTSQT